jgi:hypothetical protein
MKIIDEIAPRWQFRERHRLRVDAPPERVYAGVRAVTAREIRFFRAFTWIRRAGRHVFAAMNFHFDGATLSTETRVHAATTRAKLAFGAYWLLIRAGSGILRRAWLRAVRRRALFEEGHYPS